MAEPLEVLTESDLQRINDALDRLESAQLTIDKAQEAGFDFSRQRERVQEARGRLLRIKQTFFPGR